MDKPQGVGGGPAGARDAHLSSDPKRRYGVYERAGEPADGRSSEVDASPPRVTPSSTRAGPSGWRILLYVLAAAVVILILALLF